MSERSEEETGALSLLTTTLAFSGLKRGLVKAAVRAGGLGRKTLPGELDYCSLLTFCLKEKQNKTNS